MTPTFTSEITVKLLDHMGNDARLAAAAWVATSAEEGLRRAVENPDDVPGVINYLIKHRHGTPFEHSTLQFYIHAPIFMWREWHRHRVGFCLAGDSLIDFVNIQGTRAPGICRTIRELHDRWEHGEKNGHATDQEQLAYALELVSRGVSIRTASAKTGIARGTLTHHREGVVMGDNRGSRWRIEGMRARVLDETTQLFTHGSIADVFESGVKELLAVETVTGHKLRCSKDHRILTEEGWTTAGELRKGDRIAVVGKRSRFAERQIPPSLRRGIGVWTSMQRNRLIKEIDRCSVCGGNFSRSELTLDHTVPVVADLPRALDTSNLRPVCETCHRIKTNGEQKLARRGCAAGSKFVPLVATPTVCGEEMTYDLSMHGPHHNFVANGIVVHNSYNEESGRYSVLRPIFYIPPRHRPLIKVDGWKPGRPKFLHCEDDARFNRLVDNLKRTAIPCYEAYLDNLDMGFDPGIARSCLPVGTYSSCWVTCNPRSLMHFLSLRVHDEDAKFVSYPQWEIEQAAQACERIFQNLWPITHAAFVANGRVAP